MALLGFGTQRTTIALQTFPVLGITLDAVLSEDIQHSVVTTDHPVETGVVISDHIRDEPDQLTITGVVSRTPTNIVNAVKATLAGGNPHEDAWVSLRTWTKEHLLVTVRTSIRTWENMAIVNLSRTRSADNGEAAQFTIKLKEIVMVVSSMVEAPTRPAGVQTPAGAGGVETAGPPAVDQSILAFAAGGL